MFGVRVFSYLSEIKINVDCARTEDRRDSRVQYLRFLSGPGVDGVRGLFAAVPLHRHYRTDSSWSSVRVRHTTQAEAHRRPCRAVERGSDASRLDSGATVELP